MDRWSGEELEAARPGQGLLNNANEDWKDGSSIKDSSGSNGLNRHFFDGACLLNGEVLNREGEGRLQAISWFWFW